jgi:hypothetical protein
MLNVRREISSAFAPGEQCYFFASSLECVPGKETRRGSLSLSLAPRKGLLFRSFVRRLKYGQSGGRRRLAKSFGTARSHAPLWAR